MSRASLRLLKRRNYSTFLFPTVFVYAELEFFVIPETPPTGAIPLKSTVVLLLIPPSWPLTIEEGAYFDWAAADALPTRELLFELD